MLGRYDEAGKVHFFRLESISYRFELRREGGVKISAVGNNGKEMGLLVQPEGIGVVVTTRNSGEDATKLLVKEAAEKTKTIAALKKEVSAFKEELFSKGRKIKDQERRIIAQRMELRVWSDRFETLTKARGVGSLIRSLFRRKPQSIPDGFFDFEAEVEAIDGPTDENGEDENLRDCWVKATHNPTGMSTIACATEHEEAKTSALKALRNLVRDHEMRLREHNR